MIKWWAYIHNQDRTIHLKRWFPVRPGELCDLEYAKLEKEQGNDNILALVPSPFDAVDKDEALEVAKEIFEMMGVQMGKVVYIDPTTYPRSPLKSAADMRFRKIDLD
jgi:hypothetical protein